MTNQQATQNSERSIIDRLIQFSAERKKRPVYNSPYATYKGMVFATGAEANEYKVSK